MRYFYLWDAVGLWALFVKNQSFLKVGPNWDIAKTANISKTVTVAPMQANVEVCFYYDSFYRTYKYTMTHINFLPPPGFEPRSLDTVS